MDLANFEVGYD